MNHVDHGGRYPRVAGLVHSEGVLGGTALGGESRPDIPLVTLREIFAIARRGVWVLALCLAAALALAVLYLVRTPPEYTATAQVILEPRRATAQEAATAASAALDSAQAESQMQVVKSERILSAVFDTLDLAADPQFAHPAPSLRQELLAIVRSLPFVSKLLDRDAPPTADEERRRAFEAFTDRVAVRRIGQSYVLEITYRAATAAAAPRLTNAITAAYIHAQIEQKVAAARRGAEFLEDRFNALREEELAVAYAVRTGVIPATPIPDSDARVISAAREPLGKSAPQTGLVLAFAVAVGLLVGSGILAVRASLDRRVRTEGQILRHFGLPCVAALPVARRRRARLPFDSVISDAHSPFAQALRAAYAALAVAAGRETPARAIGVVSWRAGEGRSTIAANLANFIAATGTKTTLIDADFRDPLLSRSLAAQAATGLSEALTSNTDLAAVETVALRRNLHFLPARGRCGADQPNLFVGASQVERLLTGLCGAGEVVVDMPALASSSHAWAICGALDVVVLVVESGRTTIDEVAMAVRALLDAQARLVAVILNKRSTRHGV